LKSKSNEKIGKNEKNVSSIQVSFHNWVTEFFIGGLYPKCKEKDAGRAEEEELEKERRKKKNKNKNKTEQQPTLETRPHKWTEGTENQREELTAPTMLR
jgi:hypothetical protein